MRSLIALDTGFQDGAHHQPVRQGVLQNSTADYRQQQINPAGRMPRPEQRQGYSHLPVVSLEGFVHTLNLDAEQSTELQNIVASATSIVLASIIHVCTYSEQDFDLLHKVFRLRNKNPSSAFHLTYGLAVVEEPCWALLRTLGVEHRRTLASHLLQQYPNTREDPGLGLNNLPTVLRSRRHSTPNALLISTVSPSPSSTCPSYTSLKDRLPANGRCFCPDIDCTHKLEGFTKWGNLRNHVRTKHSSMMDESDWEERVQFRGLGEEPSKKRRNRKRRGTPIISGERVYKAGAWALGTDANLLAGIHSPGTLNGDLEDSSLPEQHYENQPVHDVPEVNVVPPDTTKPQGPPITDATPPVDTWIPCVPGGPLLYAHSGQRLSPETFDSRPYGQVPRAGFASAYDSQYGQPPDFSYQQPMNRPG